MTRHVGRITIEQENNFLVAVATWLHRHDFAGSIADDYSIYRAIEEELDRAREALKRVTTK